MLNKNDVVKSIFKAWRDVTEFIENTQDEENKYNFKPEYLITVKVAENILLYFFNNNISEQYSILLEEKTSMAMTRREEEVKISQDSLRHRGGRNYEIFRRV